MSSIDFDINNYTNEELYQLVDIVGDLTKEKIYDRTNVFIQRYLKENKRNYYRFFMQVQNKLLEILEDSGNDTDDGGDFIKTEYEPDNSNDKDLVNRKNYAKVVDTNNDHFVLRRERLRVGQGSGIPVVQGQMNPTLRNIKKQLINVDSHHRALLGCEPTWKLINSNSTHDCSGVVCPSGAKIHLAESATDFTFNLSQPIKHALKMSVYSYEIPHSWYVFSHDYGTASFGVSGECVEIFEGNYTAHELIEDISNNNHIKKNGITITLNTKNNKVTFASVDEKTSFPLVFYDPTGTIHDCSRSPCRGQGAKLDYNLGWLLGFRQPKYSGQHTYTGEALIDTYGFRYLFVELDDFNRNRLNQSIISLDAHADKFSYPASKRCALPVADASGALKSGSCGKPPPPRHGAPLTAKETYSRMRLLQAQQQGVPDRYRSPVNSDIIARIPVRKFQNYDMLFDNWNSSLEDTAREYFGPVTLKRFRIRLLNDKGYVVNLNNMDFSLSLIVEHLYQY